MKAVWVGLIALGALVLAATWSAWGGRCVDGPDFGYCETEPMVSWAGAAVLSVAGIAAIALGIRGLRTPTRRPR